MPDPVPGRWPPAYDAEDLAANIQALVQGGQLQKRFWDAGTWGPGLAQGDVLQVEARFPLLGADARPYADHEAHRFWVVLGNSCDLDRPISEVPYTLIARIDDLGELAALTQAERETLTRYRYARRFFVPAWGPPVRDRCLVLSFLEVATIDRRALRDEQVVARMSYAGWLLFHSCLVRYLARDDGRHA